MKNRTTTLLAVALLFPTFGFAKPQVIPIVNLEAYGGQTRFDGDQGSFYGNGSWSIAPVLQFPNGSAIIPSYSGLLRRTVQVQELIGGALLTQSQQDHIFNLKGIRKLGQSAWKGKLNVGYKKELLRESSNEGWGDGLFDYNKYDLGFEFEREGQKVKSFRTGLDYFTLRYPNFQSLASSQFGTEISAGTDVLDLNAVDWLTSIDVGLTHNNFFSASALLSPRYYTDAKIVEESGSFSSTKRRDMYWWMSGSFIHDFHEIKPESLKLQNTALFTLAAAFNNSNQNGFDAAQTHFTPNYYDYREWQAGPTWRVKFKEKWGLDLGGLYAQRLYSDRSVQSLIGTYTDGTVRTETQLYSGDLSYDLTRNLSLSMSVAHQISKSNQKYEQTYKYNYESTNFFVGISYAN